MRRIIGLLLPLSLAGVACGEDAIDPQTGGGGGGSTGFDVIVTDDPANDPTPGPARGPGGLDAITGEFDGSIRVALRNDAGALVPLGLTQDVLLQLQQGGDSVTLEDLTRPPADNYTGIELRFEGVTLTIEGGSEVGDSVLTNDVALDVGSAGLATVEIAVVPIDVTSATDLDIVVDLNAERWITTDNVDDGVVPQADVVNSVSVEIR